MTIWLRQAKRIEPCCDLYFQNGEEEKIMKLSARNQLKGRVVEIRKGVTTAHVLLDIGRGIIITSSITNEAADELDLKKGDDAIAVIKASDVMVAK
jgi:molybdopterin-binding protein